MAELLNCSFSQFTFNPIEIGTKRGTQVQKLSSRPIQCVLTEDNRTVVVKNGKDSLDICRVVNGMWQTSGGWGRIVRDDAVDAMLRYADAGFTTFDMADICKARLNKWLSFYFACRHDCINLKESEHPDFC